VTARDGGFEPTVEEMAEAVGPYTKAVILNSPNNPSGVVYSDEFVAGVVELCEKRNLYLIMDDTYNRLIFDGRTPTNCLRLSPRCTTASTSPSSWSSIACRRCTP
jgi:aspartate aminotransferase